MKDKIEAKAKQAREQLAAWQETQARATEQVVRWHAILVTCEELLKGEEGSAKEEEDR